MECISGTKTHMNVAGAMASVDGYSDSRRRQRQQQQTPRVKRVPPPLMMISGTQSDDQRKKQPSIAEVQKAIGARRLNNSRVKGENSPLMDAMLSGPFAQPEGSAERKLRELGEWIIDRTETRPRSGQHILMLLCLYILPVWLMALMVASGLVQLPFSVPFLDDLIT